MCDKVKRVRLSPPDNRLPNQPTDVQGVWGGGGEKGREVPPPWSFSEFFLNDKTSTPEVFCSCSFIPRAHFETSLVTVSYYDYEIWRQKQVVKPFFSESACLFNFIQE